MPKRNDGPIRVRAVKKDKPDVRALARVLIDLAIAQTAKEQADREKRQTISEAEPGGHAETTERSA